MPLRWRRCWTSTSRRWRQPEPARTRVQRRARRGARSRSGGVVPWRCFTWSLATNIRQHVELQPGRERLAKPGRPVDLDPAAPDRVAKGAVAVPDQGDGPAVGFHEYIDLEARIGDAQFHLAGLPDDPAEALGGGLVGELEADDGAAAGHAIQVHAP